MKEKLQNSRTVMEYNPEGRTAMNIIGGQDTSDKYNEPTCFAKTSRSHKKAWAALKAQWTERTSLHDAINILRDNGVKMHYYCAMD